MQFVWVASLLELEASESKVLAMSDAMNALKSVFADSKVARRAIELEDAAYFYDLALRRVRELGESNGLAVVRMCVTGRYDCLHHFTT
jgi:hypothetical protein